MSDHYYSDQPQSAMKTVTHTFYIKQHSFQFTTSTGVFSKKGLDFGSKTLIETLELPDIAGDVLDLGCGYGPIGLTIAKEHPERSIMMVDVNERAVALARQNAEQNNITNANIFLSNGLEQVETSGLAAIVTNPPIRAGKKVIYKMFADSVDRLAVGGELWIVVQKKQGAPSMFTYLESLFGEVRTVARKKGYHIIQAKRV